MARSINNLLTKGLSGMVGKQIVFRTWNGKTFMSAAPKKPKSKVLYRRKTELSSDVLLFMPKV